jgi:FMN reductase
MSSPVIVGFSGSFSIPSKTRIVVEEAVDRVAARFALPAEVYDLTQLGAELGSARSILDLSESAHRIVDRIVQAEALVVACPAYKGSYPGLFKHFFDLFDPSLLVGKPILLAATGGGEKHALIIEHQLRPLFAFFEAQTLATGVYVSEQDFSDGKLTSPAALARLDRAVNQFAPYLDKTPVPEADMAGEASNVSYLNLRQKTATVSA